MSLWLAELRAEHPARAQRMINDHWKRMGNSEVSLKDQIYNILDEHIDPMPTTKEEWNEIKAVKIAKMIKEE